jgi:hypothetical protein
MSDEFWAEVRAKELQGEKDRPVIPAAVDNFDYGNTKEEILHKIKELRLARSVIFQSALQKATAISEFAKKVTITEIKLKNGLIDKIDGIEVGNVVASAARKMAEGYCYKEMFEMEAAVALYKSNLTNIEAIKAELNGLQSVNKHLD